jgi:hypothetical protein
MLKVITDFKNEADKEDWSAYQSLRDGRPGTRTLKITRDQSGVFYNEEPEGVAGGDRIGILAPSPELTAKANETDCSHLHSYVLTLEPRALASYSAATLTLKLGSRSQRTTARRGSSARFSRLATMDANPGTAKTR